MEERPKVDLSEGSKAEAKSTAAPATAPASLAEAPKAPAQTPPSQIKHDWYQNKDNIYFSLMAKGVPKDKAQIEIEGNSVRAACGIRGGVQVH